MTPEVHEYSDGPTTFLGYLARPGRAGNRPGILVLHEAPGLRDHARLRADMLAQLGYVALAADLYGGGVTAPDFETAVSLMRSLQADPAVHRRRLRHALETLAALPGVSDRQLGAIGYCSGGTGVLELARSGAPVAAVVSFHGLLDTRLGAEPGAIKGRVLACTGSADPLVPQTQVEAFEAEMSRADTDWQIITYGGAGHAFTDREADQVGVPGFGYDARADRRSWLAMQSLFDEAFG